MAVAGGMAAPAGRDCADNGAGAAPDAVQGRRIARPRRSRAGAHRTFLFFNVVGGIAWGVGYCLPGDLAGSAYVVVEKRVGAGLAVAVAVLVLALAGTWAVRRHRAAGG